MSLKPLSQDHITQIDYSNKPKTLGITLVEGINNLTHPDVQNYERRLNKGGWQFHTAEITRKGRLRIEYRPIN